MDMTQPRIDRSRSESRSASKSDLSIGEILVQSGRLERDAALRIATAQSEHGLRFGETAVRLNFIKRADLAYALSRQFGYAYLDGAAGEVSPTLASALRPFGPVAEQIRSLRTRLVMQQAAEPLLPASLAIVSTASGEGRSFIAANLAVAFSQLGKRTLLIDADMRKPQQHRIFNLRGVKGLSNVLVGRVGPECVLQLPYLFDLSVLTAGSMPPNPQELLTSPRLTALLDELSGEFDMVIIDTPPAARYADAHLIASKVGSSVLVARANHTEAKAFNRLRVSLKDGGAHLIGTLLNDR